MILCVFAHQTRETFLLARITLASASGSISCIQPLIFFPANILRSGVRKSRSFSLFPPPRKRVSFELVCSVRHPGRLPNGALDFPLALRAFSEIVAHTANLSCFARKFQNLGCTANKTTSYRNFDCEKDHREIKLPLADFKWGGHGAVVHLPSSRVFLAYHQRAWFDFLPRNFHLARASRWLAALFIL